MTGLLVGIGVTVAAIVVVIALARYRATRSVAESQARLERIRAQREARSGAAVTGALIGGVASLAGAVVGAFSPPAGAAISTGGALLARELAS